MPMVNGKKFAYTKKGKAAAKKAKAKISAELRQIGRAHV